MAVRTWYVSTHNQSGDRMRVRFYAMTVFYGLMSGPAAPIIITAVLPVILLWKAVCTMGYDPEREQLPPAVVLLKSELHALEQSPAALGEISAARATRLLAALLMIAASPSMSRKTLTMLSLPSGAVQVPERGPLDTRPVAQQMPRS
jgi:hypothetical protein